MIHASQSREEIVALVIRDLPKTLGARHTRWNESSKTRSIRFIRTSHGYVELPHKIDIRPFSRGDHKVILSVHDAHPFRPEQEAMFAALRGHFTLVCHRHLATSPHDRSPASEAATALTHRETEVLPHLLDARTTPEIAIILGISPRTVEKHVSAIFVKNGVANRQWLIRVYLSRQTGGNSAENG